MESLVENTGQLGGQRGALDNHPHLGVEVTGLKELEGKTLERIHGTGNVTVQRGEFIARMAPHDVQIFTTDRGKFESTLLVGRDYKGQ